jgi:hypothetical protein
MSNIIIVSILLTIALSILIFFVYQILRKWQYCLVLSLVSAILWILYIQSDNQNVWDYIPQTPPAWNQETEEPNWF